MIPYMHAPHSQFVARCVGGSKAVITSINAILHAVEITEQLGNYCDFKPVNCATNQYNYVLKVTLEVTE